jgi:hypothetical protein
MRGGKRAGAGRKKHAPNRASAAREREIQATGMTPREVMLAAMRQLWAVAEKTKRDRKLNEHYVRAAASVAKDLAPYIHPRISATVTTPGSVPTKHVVEIIGGLPIGSTPERPEGSCYSEIPPEEPV